jgi:DNA mismatch repair protein MutL
MTNTNKIHLLEPLLANQIAAGEVIERPCSIIKECIENSVDANAKNINIEIINGGLDGIKIIDDGSGIYHQDLKNALLRHATSKIRKTDDLAAISSLGFRGEALSSIAAVSNCKITSKPSDQVDAWEVVSCPNSDVIIQPSAQIDGTTIEISELFYNIPARRRFLKSAKTEFQHTLNVFQRLALANPDVNFILSNNGKIIKKYSSNNVESPIEKRVAQICGTSLIRNAKYIDESIVGCRLTGWVGLPPYASRQSDCQYFFVNMRPIRDRLVMQAIRSAFNENTAFELGTHPCYALFLELPFSEVDVNVHPTKHEVRFQEARLIFEFIYQSVQNSFNNSKVIGEPFVAKEIYPQSKISTITPRVTNSSYNQSTSYQAKRNEPLSDTVEVYSVAEPRVDDFACTSSFAFLEDHTKLHVIDLKLAKKSLLSVYFENSYDNITAKQLVFPLRFQLSKDMQQCLYKIMPILNRSGFIAKITDNYFVLYQQPELFVSKVEEYDLQVLAKVQNFSMWVQRLSDKFSLLKLSKQAFKKLIQEYIVNNRDGVNTLQKSNCELENV